MQFKLTNMGRIKTADIALNGITVIAGPNGSGKSTISRALFTWFNYLWNVREEVSKERVRSIGESIEKTLKVHGESDDEAARFLTAYFRNRPLRKLADRSFWMDENESRDWWRSHFRRAFRIYVPTEEDMSCANRIYDGVRNLALYWLDKDEKEIAQFVATRCFAKAFDEQVGTYFDERATTEVSLESDEGVTQASWFFGGVSSALVGVENSNVAAYKGMRMFYLEPAHMLDAVPTELRTTGRKSSEHRYSVNDKDVRWEQILRKELKRKDMTFEQSERLAPIFAELDKIVSTIHGEIGTVDNRLMFKDADLPGDKTISLMNIASGTKSMAAIVRGMRNDSIHPGDFLIIDEPESNLHPDWQVAFARFLVLLHAKFGIRMLLNTHSPYFLKAIEVCSDSYEMSDDCSFYNMVSQDERQYDAVCVNGNTQDIFKAMSRPFSKLMRGESYERSLS